MRKLHTRHGITLVAVAAASVLVLTSCSSEPDATETPSASAAMSDSAVPSASASADVISVSGAVAGACAAYFELDLLNSTYAGGAVADGDMTEEQVRAQFQAGLKDLVAQAKLAVDDGSADRKLLVNAKRMRKQVNSLAKADPLSAMSAKRQTRFAKSSLRVQRACTRAGLPLPADNVTARTAAGI